MGKRTILLAAHCVKPGQPNIVCFDKTTTYRPQTLVAHKDWDDQTLANDIGLGILDHEPPITPSVVARKRPDQGQTITLVGFGNTGETTSDAGTKRVATNTIKDLWATRFSYAGSGGAIGNTCKGDSGGPAFATMDGRETQVGVTSAGLKPCGTLGYSTRVDSYQTWIEQHSNGDLYDPTADTAKPTVSFTAPQDGATLVGLQVPVKIAATDNVGVQDVELFADGTSAGKLTAPPYDLTISLTKGNHTLRAVARDAAGNQGETQITIIVTESDGPTPPTPGAFGSKCDAHLACVSNLCGGVDGVTYCTETCDPEGSPCPQGAECLPAGSDRYVCGPPATVHGYDGAGVLQGGCHLGRGAGGLPSALIVPLLLLLVGRLRRR